MRKESTKTQTPGTKEAPILKLQNVSGSGLNIGGWSFPEVWRLVFGAFIPSVSTA
jgi:hypothetical protein